jgi:hypothetical protein
MIVLGGESVEPVSLFSEMLHYLAAADAALHISERPCWIKLSSLDVVDISYDRLAKQLIRDLSALLHIDLAKNMTWYGLTVFIASPHVVTPYYIDDEYNFLFLILGRKQICLFNQDDRYLFSDRELERFYIGVVESARYQPMREASGTAFDLNNQNAIHHRPMAPHCVRDGDSVSISLSSSFCTRRLDRRARVYQANHCMRRAGLSPSPPDRNRLVDSIKSFLINLFSKSRLNNQRNFYTLVSIELRLPRAQ